VTLRRRLVLSVIVLALTLGLAGTTVLLAQRRYLVGQLDTQITALARSPRALLVLSARPNVSRLVPEALGEVYVGQMAADGTLTTVLAPADDPSLVPRLTPGQSLPQAVGRGSASGVARRVRVITAPLRDGTQAVVAVPTTRAEAATRRLALTLGLAGLAILVVVGLVVWWVFRLGLRPIAAMTDTADAIASGDLSRRVPPGPQGSEVERLGHALNAMVDTTQGTQERMRRFVADASHELRTPLTTLQGYSSLHTPGGGASPEVVDDAMRRINAEATRMARIVQGLLQLTDLDAHGVAVHEPVDLVPMLADVVSDLRVVQPERPVSLEAPSGLVVTGDRDRLFQAVVALTSNAMRHTPESAPIVVRAYAVGPAARIEVADGGPGIDPQHLPHLFDRFYRADQGRARSQGGNGLGLAVVAAIVTAHAGRYGVSSTPGQGSTFWCEIPLRSTLASE
jgi:two-component system OmpR family sensor kinase